MHPLTPDEAYGVEAADVLTAYNCSKATSVRVKHNASPNRDRD